MIKYTQKLFKTGSKFLNNHVIKFLMVYFQQIQIFLFLKFYNQYKCISE